MRVRSSPPNDAGEGVANDGGMMAGLRWRPVFRRVMLNGMADVTLILAAIEQGDPHAPEQLLPLVYDELRQLAAAKLANEKPGQTLQATALVHEAYLRLLGGEQTPDWDGRRHFFAAAAEAMRRILIDRARHKQTCKAGAGRRRLDLDDIEPAPVEYDDDRLLALDEALGQLEAEDPRKAELVKLRFFAGLTAEQAAAALGVSTSTAEKDWAYARSWLRVAIDRMSARRP
jgi:RNA polymerase sigma factor (TIGR02999 family)